MIEDFDKARIEGIIPHIFLPRKLPSSQSKDLVRDDSYLLQLVTEIVRSGNGVPIEVVKLFDTWFSLQNGDGLDPSLLYGAIRKLDVGDMLALYIRQQNTGLLLSMPTNSDDNHAIFSTFQASLPNLLITSSPAVIAMEFPEQSIKIPFSHVLGSKTFCEQLSILSTHTFSKSMAEVKKNEQRLNDERDIPNTMFVSKWLTASLTNRESTVCSRIEYPKILKKIRDEVLINPKGEVKVDEFNIVGSTKTLPFRRSGFWMTIKAVLHLSLIRQMGELEGQFLYKLILIQMMRQVCEFLLRQEYGKLDIDLSMQMIAKMARRLEKLAKNSEPLDISSSKDILDYHSQIHTDVREIIALLRQKIGSQHYVTIRQDKFRSELKPLVGINFEQDIKHSARKVRRYLESRRSGNTNSHVNSTARRQDLQRHGLKIVSFPLIENLLNVPSTDEEKMGIYLFYYENWIFQNLNGGMDFALMRSLALVYSQKASEYYKDDQVGISRMVLALLKIIEVMDRFVCQTQQFALLKEHSSGINTKFIQDLLLPQRQHLELACELEKYFNGRNAGETHQSLIDEHEVEANSFSSRYAGISAEMCAKRDRIIANGEFKVQEKKNEIFQKKQAIIEFRRQLSLVTEHTTETRTNYYGRTYVNHDNRWSYCRKCNLEREMNKCTVNVYEKPLREEVHNQNAVVFELMVPKEIACLRDVLFIFRKCVREANTSSSTRFGYVSGSQSRNIHIAETWTENSELILEGNSSQHQQFIHLGSSKKLYSHTHLSKQLADCDENKIILNNGGSCTFYAKENNNNVKLTGDIDVKTICTFKVEENSAYKTMQWALNSTEPMENHALANQGQCPSSISFSEFVQFGSLRSGHRLQLRNIYRAFVAGNLSFKNQSVVSLISQCLWEAGPNENQQWFREAHQDYVTDSEFLNEFCLALNEFKESQRKNWKHPFNLLNVILITVRVLEMTSDPNCVQRFQDLLLSCRDVVMEWIEKVEEVIKVALSKDQSSVENLRSILVDVGICGALTFGVTMELSQTDLKCWLSSIIKIDTNLAKASIGLFRRNLLRRIRNIGIEIEEKCYVIAEWNDFEFLNQFSTELWSGWTSENFSWEKSGHGYLKKVQDENGQDQYIELDFISGRYLVNGFSMARLPQEITSHEIFQRVFHKTIFEVQPKSTDTFVTISKYNGSKYTFLLIKSTGVLIITEFCENGDRYELIPHTFLEGEIPHLLILDYCHWWNREKEIIEFRPILHFLESPSHEIHYVLNLKSMELREEGISKRHLVDICSKSFKHISTFMAGFELSKYLNIFVDDKQVIVELQRMNLKFKVEKDKKNKTYQLVSQEYEDMYVCRKLKPDGVLVGLRNGLLLEDLCGDQKFLVPHGKVEIYALDGYQHVEIGQNNLRNPSYFAYEVDEKFQQFKMGKTNAARFYLANLHAVTGTALEDPFTGMTGTEKALQILQSGYCWSSEPYDEESLDTMNQIKSLSPSRNYPEDGRVKSLATVTWPSFTHATSVAHELFEIVITGLIDDSLKLQFLHTSNHTRSTSEIQNRKFIAKAALNLKSYYRNLCYSPNLAVFPCFLKNIHLATMADMNTKRMTSKFLELIPPQFGNRETSSLENIRVISDLANGWKFSSEIIPDTNERLDELLRTGPQLIGISTAVPFFLTRIDEWMEIDFKNNWLKLYNFARVVRRRNLTSEWTLLMTTLAFRGISLADLLMLHTIAVNPRKFEDLNPPTVPLYEKPAEEFTRIRIMDILMSSAIGIDAFLQSNNCMRPGTYYGEEYRKFTTMKAELTEKYNLKLNIEMNSWISKLQEEWTSKSSENSNSLTTSRDTLIRISVAKPALNIAWKRWNDNRKLGVFLDEVSEILDNIFISESINEANDFKPSHWKIIDSDTQSLRVERFEIDYETKMIQNFGKQTESNLRVEEIFRTGELACPFEYDIPKDATASSVDINILQGRQTFYKEQSREHWEYLKTHVNTVGDGHLVHAGLFPRILPTIMIGRITKDASEVSLNDFIGGIGVIWVLEQRATRMLKYAKKRSLMENALRREMETMAETKNWSPRDKPEWLIFELEQNVMIRRIQIEIANRMIHPPNEKHCVMQLNMGEGKTSVIVPLIAAMLSDGNQLCRVTVLQSLFKTNLGSLRNALGGLLNRRVFTFPCTREMMIGKNEAQKILEVYEDAKEMKGILMTIPEYRLSAQLKLYDAGRRYPAAASILMKIHRWLNSNVRDILDESDEILSAKYQLIYTQGNQCPPGGGELRWTILQDLLKLIPLKMYTLWKMNKEKDSKEEMEFDENVKDQNGPEVFWPCRFLSPKLYPELVDALAEDFLDGNTSIKFIQLKSADRDILKEFITNIKVDEETHNEALALCEKNERLQNTILILAGLFKYDVLRLVLSKRWRVNYGVNVSGRLKMAVPFKAKDVAAEMTEFGHPDVAICLTHLSYYYSGLSYDQFKACFDILDASLKASEIYEGWISKMTSNEVPDSMKSYESVNLHDAKYRQDLYSLLKMNMYLIDFWLSKTVLPKEARQYENKMMCTAWDLCSADLLLVTGFSGTNDSKPLLPIPISQEDLQELENTNEEVRQSLLSAENDYRVLPPNVSGRFILDELVKNEIPVLLDSGALMLELNNEQVAQEWLTRINYKRKVENDSVEVEVEIEGAVYFNKVNTLMVMDRHNQTREFESSPFSERLDRCVVYLDDAHTRGTDLKFPKNTRACVTLTGGITRDKTVQACMRMRMLGKGHFISFFASQEAHNGIRNLCFEDQMKTDIDLHEIRTEVTTKHVTEWIQKNSDVFVEDGLVHWASAGFNYAQKRAAHHATPGYLTHQNLNDLSSRCSDNEVIDLMDFYGKVKKEILLSTIVQEQFLGLLKKCQVWSFFDTDVHQTVVATGNEIVGRLKEKIPKRTRYAELLDEEQEKEIEKEVEQEAEVAKRRAFASPEVSKLDENIKILLTNSGNEKWWNDNKNLINIFNDSLIELPRALGQTKFGTLQSWGELVFVTKDFLSVIEQEYRNYRHRLQDPSFEFLRPVSWIVSIDSHYGSETETETKKMLILLSPFEANAYFELFRSNQTAATLHMYSPSLKLDQNSLVNKTQLQVPSTNRIILDDHLRVQLSVFSGSLYFQDNEEREEYCHFTGFIPRLNRSTKHQLDFDNGFISKGGFVLPEYRQGVSQEIALKCKFENDPSNIITEIVENRHGSMPISSHVASMLVPNSLNEPTPSSEDEDEDEDEEEEEEEDSDSDSTSRTHSYSDSDSDSYPYLQTHSDVDIDSYYM